MDCNHKPKWNGADEAMVRRLLLIPFNVTIPKSEIDLNLPSKLKAEASGILNWMLDGLRQVHIGGQLHMDGLKPPTYVREAVRQYASDNDTFGQFLSERTQDNPIGKVKSSELYMSYDRWCKSQGEKHVMSQTAFSLELKRRKYDVKPMRDGKYVVGLEMTSNECDSEMSEADDATFDPWKMMD